MESSFVSFPCFPFSAFFVFLEWCRFGVFSSSWASVPGLFLSSLLFFLRSLSFFSAGWPDPLTLLGSLFFGVLSAGAEAVCLISCVILLPRSVGGLAESASGTNRKLFVFTPATVNPT